MLQVTADLHETINLLGALGELNGAQQIKHLGMLPAAQDCPQA